MGSSKDNLLDLCLMVNKTLLLNADKIGTVVNRFKWNDARTHIVGVGFVKKRGIIKKKFFLPFSSIIQVGKDAVIILDATVLPKTKRTSNKKEVFRLKKQNIEVFIEGDKKGFVKSYCVEIGSGRIVKFTVGYPGEFDNIEVPRDAVMSFGKNRMMVRGQI